MRHRAISGSTPKPLNSLLRKALSNSSSERAGRPSKITEADLRRLAKLSQQLLPLCIAFVRLQLSDKKRGGRQYLDFLELDFPEQVTFLKQHQERLESVLKDNELLAHIKTPIKQAEKLADIFAGFAFEMSPQYAMQQAQAARLRLDRKSSIGQLAESEENC